MRDRVAAGVAAIAAVLHLAVAGRYDLFRDELYFIVCGRHPAFGYVDQPPLVPLLAAGGYALGGQTWVVRVPAIVAAAALAYVVVRIVRILGGGEWAAWTAGLGAALAPMFAGLTATLNTTTLEPLAWTSLAYLVLRAIVRGDRAAPLAAGFVVGAALEAKYAIVLWVVALAAGLACTHERRLLAWPEFVRGCALAIVLAAPSIAWQALHGWPFVELVRNAHLKDTAVSPLAFALNQIVVYGPVFAPLWIGGLIAPFAIPALRPARFVAIGFAICAVAIVAGHGKDYYLAPAVPTLFGIGAVAFEQVVRSARIRVAYATLAVACALPLLPLALPIVPPGSLLAYEAALHLAPQQQEHADAADRFPSTFADMLGWHDFVREVGTAYRTLSASERASTALLVDDYGEAAALDLYGAPYGLPPALAGQNQYYLWGPGPPQRSVNLLRVQDDLDALRPYCRSVRLFGTTRSPFARSFENGKVIAFCAGLHPPLAKIWPALKIFI